MAANKLAASQSKQNKFYQNQISNKQLGLHFELVILWNYVGNTFVSIFVLD